MWSRIIYEDYNALITLTAFVLTALAFVVLVRRALRMKKSDREHMSNLPLEDDHTRAPEATDDNHSSSDPSQKS